MNDIQIVECRYKVERALPQGLFIEMNIGILPKETRYCKESFYKKNYIILEHVSESYEYLQTIENFEC